jgi:hypothetical protein
MAMWGRGCNAAHITQDCFGGYQGNRQTKKDEKCINFDGHFDGNGNAPVRYHVHCLIDEVQGFCWTLPSGKHLLQYHQLDMPTPAFVVFSSSTH